MSVEFGFGMLAMGLTAILIGGIIAFFISTRYTMRIIFGMIIRRGRRITCEEDEEDEGHTSK